MQHIAVESSNVKSIAWEPNEAGDSGTLQVALKPKKEGEIPRVYQYENVPYKAWTDFLHAKSIGSHFAIHIRSNYVSRRIDTPKEEAKDNGEEAKGSQEGRQEGSSKG